ncbi:MAG: PEP-CTERM sorting domain-containing protein [Armatimonadetes bacterium]|nr:PEP-CTERM sorting domain-containing protein [Armatimonadota bacterium]
MKYRKIAVAVGFLSLICASQAQVVYSNVIATVAFTPEGFEEIEWITEGSMNEIIAFLTGDVPVIVGDATEHTTATVNILYEAHANFSMGALGMVIQGEVLDWGRITWSEVVEDMNDGNQIVGMASGMFLGAEHPGGENGPINFSDQLTFSNASTDIKVKKSFILDIAGQELPTTTLAEISLIEQNLIPEPASFLAVGGTLVLMGLRRRRK